MAHQRATIENAIREVLGNMYEDTFIERLATAIDAALRDKRLQMEEIPTSHPFEIPVRTGLTGLGYTELEQTEKPVTTAGEIEETESGITIGPLVERHESVAGTTGVIFIREQPQPPRLHPRTVILDDLRITMGVSKADADFFTIPRI